MLVVTPTATSPPIELVTVYVRVALGAYAQVVAVASPLIATVGFCCTVKAVALVALAEAGHPALSTAVKVTPNPVVGHPALGLWQVTVTSVGEPAAVVAVEKGRKQQDSSIAGAWTGVKGKRVPTSHLGHAERRMFWRS